MFLQSPEGSDSSRAASALLFRLDRKRRDRWSEAVQTIDFSHSSRKAWSILNNLTGRSRRSPRHCAVSANAIASVLVNNGKYEDIDRKSSRLVSQKVSDLWRASTTSAVNVCGSFTPSKFAAALKHLKPGKALGPDSICPELLLHAGAALKSWLCGFLSSCLHHLKIPKIWRRALVVAIPKPMKPHCKWKWVRKPKKTWVMTLGSKVETPNISTLVTKSHPTEMGILTQYMLPK